MIQKRFCMIFLATFLTACNTPTARPVTISTPDVGAIQTQVVATVYAEALTASVPTITPTQFTPTPTYDPPKAHFDEDSNCRVGPGIKFVLVAIIKAGQTAELVGAPPQGNYWVVKNPSGNEACWVVRDFATPSGSVETLPTVGAPATYTPQPAPPAVTLKTWKYSCAYAANNSSAVTINLEWDDLSDYEFGYNIYLNNKVIAGLGANSTAYTDITYLANGQAATYFVEAYNFDGVGRSREVKAICQ